MAQHEIIYVSLATHAASGDDLQELLESARARNARHGITGMLLYHRQEFLQLIEGERSAVQALYASICHDPRHQHVHTLWEGAVQKRSFADWSMGFVSPNKADLRERPGYASLMNQGVLHLGPGTVGKQLLLRLSQDFLGPG